MLTAYVLVAACCRTRITLDMMGVPLTGTFDSDTETLTITHKEQEDAGDSSSGAGQQAAAGSAEGRRRSFQQQQQQGWQQDSSSANDSQQQQQEPVSSSAQLGLNNEHFNLRVWLDHMQGKVINRQHIPKTELPLQVGWRGKLDLGTWPAKGLMLTC